MISKEIDEQVNQLLHDAIRAVSGAEMAAQMGDAVNARLILVRAAEGFAHALRLDPKAEAEAWKL